MTRSGKTSYLLLSGGLASLDIKGTQLKATLKSPVYHNTFVLKILRGPSIFPHYDDIWQLLGQPM